MRFEAYRDFYVQGLPYLDGVRINIVPDEAGLVAALRTKAADVALFAEARAAQRLRSGVTVGAMPSPNYTCCSSIASGRPSTTPRCDRPLPTPSTGSN